MLTTNQIILLLDIYRGTITQDKIVSYENDLTKLTKYDLIFGSDDNYTATSKGVEKVIEVRQLFYNLIKEENDNSKEKI